MNRKAWGYGLLASASILVLLLFIARPLWPGTPPQRSELSAAIVELMDKYLPKQGLTIITDEICDFVSESALREAAGELSELTPETWTAGVGHPLAPSGSLRGEFQQDAQFLYNQSLLIFVSDEDHYCEAKIENVFGL